MRREDQAQPRQAKRSALPSWLSGQTVALLGSMLVLGMFCQNGFTSMRQEMNSMRQDMNNMRTELKGDIAELRKELKGDIAELRTDFRRLEDRTRALEVAVTGINVRLDNLERVVGGIDVRLDNLEQVVAGINNRLDSLEQVVDGVRGLVEGADLRPSASQGGRVAQGP